MSDVADDDLIGGPGEAAARRRILAEAAPADSLWTLVRWRAECTPDAIMASDERGRALTFGQYAIRCERVAAGFQHQGVTPGARVAWMLPTCIEALVVQGALARLGVVQVPLLPILRQREVAFILGRTGARLLVVPGEWRGFDYAAMARQAVAEIDPPVVITVVDTALHDAALPEADAGGLPPEPASTPDARWIFFTSGTTADPKGVLHSDATVAACALSLNIRFDMVPDDRNALVFPITHIGGLSWLMGGLMGGYRHLLIESFNGPDSCPRLAREGVTVSGAGPAFWAAFIDYQRRHPEARQFPTLRALLGGGAAKPATMNEDVGHYLGITLAPGYGLTECPAALQSGVHSPAEVRLHDGHPLDGVEVRIVTRDGRRAAPGETGEVRVRGPMLFLGYLDPAHDVGAFDTEGFHCTGDLGAVDERDVITITGRLKDIIIRKGENLSAKEIEDALIRHADIADVAVIGLPDDVRGELACAVVVLADGSQPLTLADLAAHCDLMGLARQKAPERVEFVAELPRNPTGKVVKRALQARFGPPAEPAEVPSGR
jgi:cyclohexanecarboxylate-CoA ligase